MLSAALLTACTLSTMSIPDETSFKLPPMEQNAILVFHAGERKREYSQDELQEMQKAHIGNLGRLFSEKKAPAAGPFAERGEFRGIVILQMPLDKIPAEFEQDPFVKEGLLKITVNSWMMPKGLFAWPQSEEFKMHNYSLVRWLKGPNWTADVSEELSKANVAHVTRNLSQMRDGSACIHGPVGDPTGEWRGLSIFPTDDKAKVEALLAEDPLLKRGHFRVEIKPLMMGAGLFNPLKP
ncbi:MAG: YciI family protein [Armatimonadetes bacterium]|nr:YciI family protein [Armatimonadota bacterium]